ncbi:MAG: VWA domain-containing protein [Oleiphilaceae bacterium]|nr:VWA domain-containing protein [Oleiphilaceae bacterium]
MKITLPLAAGMILVIIAGCASNTDDKTAYNPNKEITPPAATIEMDQIAPVEDRAEAQAALLEDQPFIDVIDPYLAQAAPHKFKKAESKRQVLSPAPYSHTFMPPTPTEPYPTYYQDEGREHYAALSQSAVMQVTEQPVSTFSIDVDTASYANVRRMLNQGALPPANAVRVEEMINYFDYNYEAPNTLKQPFSIHTELAQAPWSEHHVLLRVGLKGYAPPAQMRPATNLVFLLDVSGSMNAPNKLPLLKKSLALLTQQLSEHDSVAIVVYAGASGVVLEPTKGNDRHKILAALEQLSAGGSTNGQAGIELAYQLAKQHYLKEGINRVILATDGDFNVGLSNVDALKALIEHKRKEGIYLTTLGFGTGNYNDALMETLADHGNGNYAYIDTFSEAQKVLGEQLQSTLMTIAKDVKIQVEFNPGVVKEYRLIGYENRTLKREDFNNDLVDAGEIGAGHTVTALYELVLHHSPYSVVDPLRYQPNPAATSSLNNELAFIKFRYKAPEASHSQLLSQAISLPERIPEFEHASESFRFSASVAQFGEALRQSKYVSTNYEAIIGNALQAKGTDDLGYRSEFIQLVRLAAKLSRSS